MPINKLLVIGSWFIVHSKKQSTNNELIAHHQKGFTIIEILITIIIISIIVGVIVPNLKNFNSDQQRDEAVTQVIQVLKQAQSGAMSGIRCKTGEQSLEWIVTLKQDQYSLAVTCGSVATPTTETKIPDTFYNSQKPNLIKANLTACGNQGDLSISFYGSKMEGKCSTVGSPTPTLPFFVDLTNTQSNSGQSATTKIEINSQGVINKINPSP